MTPAEHEIERKFLVPPGWTAPAVPGLGAWTEPRRHDLRAEYLDTPGYDLARAGWSLRRRTGGDDAGWHLKRPVAADVRREEWRPEAPELPADFRAAVDELAGPRPLVPVAVLVTARVERDLVSDARVRAHLAEDAVTAVVGGEVASWHEVETELAPGEPPDTLDALEAALLAGGATRAPHGSKVARALADAVARPRPAPGRDTPAGEVLLGYAAKQVGALQSLAAGVRSDAPDAVHKTRVACRRLRGLLRTFGPLFEPQRTDPLAEELQWFGEIAGGPRDAEVLKEHLLEALAALDPGTVHGPVAERLVADLDRLHADAHDRLVAVMAGERYRALHRSLAALLTDPPLGAAGLRPARLAFPGLFARAVERVGERHARALRKPAELERWHQVRKAAKAARYSAEVLADVYGDAARDHAALFEAVTEALGEVQDTVVAHDTLGHLEAAAVARGEPTLTYRVLQQRQLDRRAAALRAGRAALDVALAADRAWLS
nr:CYTH and CHAD domain-containing protein [Propionibacterium sp.]